ncbi:hypothetical protein D9757_004559 [Collybiopsis confluens]|uniref:Uncharacterized protein n=1 Tax=Collybiopsis confluens TaxID=2823264 RepID=A0A8H5HWC1_9AGAR|nr:hypothetical protein D9757_004559 [Collybiopsis confluens]
MLFSSTFTALVSLICASAAFAGPVHHPLVRRDNSSNVATFTSCSFVVTSVPDLSGNVQAATTDLLHAETDLISNEYPQSISDEEVDILVLPIVHNTDGTNNATSTFLVGEVTVANLTSFIESWVGRTVAGPTAQWTFKAATCHASRVTCDVVVSPTPEISNITDAGNDLLDAEAQQVVDRFPDQDGWFLNNDQIAQNADGSYNVTSSLQVGNVTDGDLLALANSWAGQTVDGAEAQWAVETAECHLDEVDA